MYDWSTHRRTGCIHCVIPAKAKPFFIHLIFIASICVGSVFFPVFGKLYGQTLKSVSSFAPLKALRLQSNTITDIRFDGPNIWLGTGSGLMVTSDGGQTYTSFDDRSGMAPGSTSAIALGSSVIWIATAFDTVINDETFSAGGGLSWSDDSGVNWNFVDQPVDPNDEESLGYKPTTTIVQNVTFDIALDGSSIWITSWGGGLRKSEDNGLMWAVVTSDGLPFDALGNLNHRTFSVISAANGLWTGTAQGINKSTDGGETWTHYTAQNGSGISGNFITQLAEQITSDGSIIWATTWKAEDENEFYAVSRTTNNGLTWETMLEGEFVHNFGFDGDAVYVVSGNGLFKSPDRGKTWGLFPSISSTAGEQILTTEYFDVKSNNGIIWVGTNDGLGTSIDNGQSWDVFRAFPIPGSDGESEAYAYPNPFSPLRHNRIGDDGYVRIQYRTLKVTEVFLDVFDFGMNPVKNVVSNKARPIPGIYTELWDGTNTWGVMVANGVYFYRLKVRGQATFWGKIIVMN